MDHFLQPREISEFSKSKLLGKTIKKSKNYQNVVFGQSNNCRTDFSTAVDHALPADHN